jgi:low affinity Fe/Cu permease
MKEAFRKISQHTSATVGHPFTFFLALMIIIIWAFTGKYFNYSDTWQLVINTGTTIVTFLIVFLIQNTQNRDTKAINLKLDEIIFSIKKADNKIIDVNNLTDEQLETLETSFERIARKRSR